MNFDSMETRLQTWAARPGAKAKAVRLGGAVLAALGIVLLLVGAVEQSPGLMVVASVVLLAGLGTVAYSAAKRQADAPVRLTSTSYVCPNPACTHAGPAAMRSRSGNGAIIVLLLLAGIIPGLLAMVVMGGNDILCAKCGVFIRRSW